MSTESPSAQPPLTAASGPPPQKIVIVGAGFSGTSLANALLRTSEKPLDIILIDARYPFGQGVAYSTEDKRHLLNVPAKSMSALPEDPTHFVTWLRDAYANGDLETTYGPNHFVPRMVYGSYLRNTLAESQQKAPPGVSLRLVSDEVVNIKIEHGRAALLTKSGRWLKSRAVVLALGNLPPRRFHGVSADLLHSGVFQPDPWKATTLDGIPAETQVMILGTGLTMVDLMIGLEGRGHRGQIYALSRRGLLPRGHLHEPIDTSRVSLPDTLEASRPSDLASLVRRFRRYARNHDGPWQEVVDSLRSITPTLWRDLSPHDRQRFLHRYRAYWDVHRSRIAPDVADGIIAALARNQLQVRAGKVTSISPVTDVSAQVTWRDHVGGEISVTVGRVINATGPETNLSYTKHSLLKKLVASGALEPDATGLGISVDDRGVARGNSPVPIYVLGPLRRNESYEGIAVPELRVQAWELASDLRKRFALTSNL